MPSEKSENKQRGFGKRMSLEETLGLWKNTRQEV